MKASTAWDPAEERQLMVQIKNVQIENCDTTLHIYFAEQASGNSPDVTLSCHQDKYQPTYITDGAHVTFRLETNKYTGYEFEILVTAFYKTSTTDSCNQLQCEESDHKCISHDLGCDGYTNCLSGSDEQECFAGGGYDVDNYKSFKWGVKAFIIVAFAGIFIVIIFVAIVVVCCKRRNPTRGRTQHGYSQAPTSTTQITSHDAGRKMSFPLTHTAYSTNPIFNAQNRAAENRLAYHNLLQQPAHKPEQGYNSSNLGQDGSGVAHDGIYPTTSKGTSGGMPPDVASYATPTPPSGPPDASSYSTPMPPSGAYTMPPYTVPPSGGYTALEYTVAPHTAFSSEDIEMVDT